MIRWTGLAPWEFELPFPGSLTSTFLSSSNFRPLEGCRGPLRLATRLATQALSGPRPARDAGVRAGLSLINILSVPKRIEELNQFSQLLWRFSLFLRKILHRLTEKVESLHAF